MGVIQIMEITIKAMWMGVRCSSLSRRRLTPLQARPRTAVSLFNIS
ncbi:MAG: hypothetical protein M1401_05695 [Chloroflexi bacterium]|nr:hypothetical protein [Chloroflexota bacterium]